MSHKPRVFLDTSALVAAVLSETGGARLLLKMGEAGAIRVVVGGRVLAELDGVIGRKAPEARPFMALLLDAARIDVGPTPTPTATRRALGWVDYTPDAHVLAEAIAARAEYFVTLDRAHFLGNPKLHAAPFMVGTPGDCIAWLRERFSAEAP